MVKLRRTNESSASAIRPPAIRLDWRRAPPPRAMRKFTAGLWLSAASVKEGRAERAALESCAADFVPEDGSSEVIACSDGPCRDTQSGYRQAGARVEGDYSSWRMPLPFLLPVPRPHIR